jgi:hypothetical protein
VGLRVRDLEQNNAELGGWCAPRRAQPCAPERLTLCAAPPKAPDAQAATSKMGKEKQLTSDGVRGTNLAVHYNCRLRHMTKTLLSGPRTLEKILHLASHVLR